MLIYILINGKENRQILAFLVLPKKRSKRNATKGGVTADFTAEV